MADVKVLKAEDLESLVDIVTKALKETKIPDKKSEPKNETSFEDVLTEATKLGEELAKEVIKTLEKTTEKKEAPKKCECSQTSTKMDVDTSITNVISELNSLTEKIKNLNCRLDEIDETIDALITDVTDLKELHAVCDEDCDCCDDDCECCDDCCCDDECDCCDEEDSYDVSYAELLEAITCALACVREDKDIFSEDFVEGYKSAMSYLIRCI